MLTLVQSRLPTCIKKMKDDLRQKKHTIFKEEQFKTFNKLTKACMDQNALKFKN